MSGSMSNTDRLNHLLTDSRYWTFLSYFNKHRDYYECHEVMEELWLEDGRSALLQGLLQAAVGLHHWDNSNRSGAVKLMTAALTKLNEYSNAVLGLDVARLRCDLRSSLDMLASRPKDAPFQAFELVVLDESLLHAVDEWEKFAQSHVDDEN